MALEPKLEIGRLLQPLKPRTSIPDDFPRDGLFLLNFSPVLAAEVWDDYGHKEVTQARHLRKMASIIQSMADDFEELGHVLMSYPDPNDLDEDVYEETWEVTAAEMEDVFEKGYALMAEHVLKMKDAAIGDFMD
jgi:hypothetical protein